MAVSSKTGVIRIKVAKHPLWTTGLLLLPKYTLRPSTLSATTITTLKHYLFEPRHLVSKMFRGFEINIKSAGRKDMRTAFFVLRDTVGIMWSNLMTHPEVRVS